MTYIVCNAFILLIEWLLMATFRRNMDRAKSPTISDQHKKRCSSFFLLQALSCMHSSNNTNTQWLPMQIPTWGLLSPQLRGQVTYIGWGLIILSMSVRDLNMLYNIIWEVYDGGGNSLLVDNLMFYICFCSYSQEGKSLVASSAIFLRDCNRQKSLKESEETLLFSLKLWPKFFSFLQNYKK